jgi:D-aminoacyl-tRNA deacylase
MYNKFLIVASKLDKAGINITTQLSQFGNFNFYLVEEDVLHTENLDLSKINEYDFIIFASKHQSQKKEKTLSIHAPGNWNNANFGGEFGKVCRTSAQFLKQTFNLLKQNQEKFELEKYNLTLECTHHGPLISKPCMFIEIGATEIEWNDRRAAFVVAKTISEIIQTFKENTYNENVIAIGGPHYCPGFNKLQLGSNYAISHVIPQYAFPLTESIVQEAIDNTDEEVDLILLDWKGLGNKESREQVLSVLDKFYIQYKRTSEVPK